MQATDLVPLGRGRTDGRAAPSSFTSSTTRPARTGTGRATGWSARLHQQPEDALWHELADAEFAVHRVGDCLAPRRAHAAVVEGHRVAAAL